jgi:hypothetical protein
MLELLYWAGCPSYPEALALLQDVLRAKGRADEIVVREVRTQQEAEALQFPGSPTIRVDGRDVDGDGARASQVSLGCRVYVLPDGRFSPVPSRAQLEEALA